MYEQVEYGATTAGYATQDVPTSVVDRLNVEVLRLAEKVECASQRLTKVLAPEFGADSKVGSEPMPVVSPIQQTLIALQTNIDRLSLLIDRVEA